MDPRIEEYFYKATSWQEELTTLRAVLLDCGLKEEFKWRAPCYTFNKKNIVILHSFKECAALGFFKGGLLNDTYGLLVKPGENSQSGRMIKCNGVEEIIKNKAKIKSYILQAVEVEKSGLKIEYKKADDFEIPEEFQRKMEELPALKKAFYKLTPGRQKGYLLHFSGAKQPKTREARIEKYTGRILDLKGIHDCVCGMSKKYPTCDGSHKFLKTETK